MRAMSIEPIGALTVLAGLICLVWGKAISDFYLIPGVG